VADRKAIRQEEIKASRRVARVEMDGFEDEFGDKPPLANNADWFDRVIVDRVLFGGRAPGRMVYPLEQKEIVTSTAASLMTMEEIGRRSGVTKDTVSKWYKRYNPIGAKE
jgi:hypothetical protein